MTSDQASTDLVVLGAGLPRTGTASLQIALEHLLGDRCYQTKEIISKPQSVSTWIKAIDEGLSEEEWKQLLSGYRFALNPCSFFYPELLKLHPNVKVILTTRNPRSWVTSLKNTASYDPLVSRFPEIRKKLLSKALGADFDVDNEEQLVQRFKRWNDKVKEGVPANQLLVFDSSMGWEPLCSFLGVPVPDIPYPHANTSEEFEAFVKSRDRKLMMVDLAVKMGIAISIGLLGYIMAKKF